MSFGAGTGELASMGDVSTHVGDGFGVPAGPRSGAMRYDNAGLESLIGVLSTTDSQRLRKAVKAAGGRGDSPDKDSLVQRASAEEWRLRREVCTPAYPAHIFIYCRRCAHR